MTRLLNASVSSYIAQPEQTFYTLCDMILDSGTIRTFNGAGYLMVGANTYVGIGDLGEIDPVQEDTMSFPRGIRITVTGVASSNMLSEAMQENFFNREVKLYRCWWDTTSLSIVNTAECWYSGRINEVNMVRRDSDRGDYIEFSVYTRLKREVPPHYYTTQDMMVGPYSGDTFFEYTAQIPGFVAYWGGERTYFSLTPGGGGTSIPPVFADELSRWIRARLGG